MAYRTFASGSDVTAVSLVRSKDCGEHWTNPVTVTSIVGGQAPGVPFRTPTFAFVAVDDTNPARFSLKAEVMEGIKAALDAGLTPVKLNMVVLSGINDEEVPAFLDFVKGNRNLVLQLIELMDIRDCPYHSELSRLEEELARQSTHIITRRMHHRHKYCCNGSEVEVVRPLHNTEFCAFCNRLRLTSDGMLKPCLLRAEPR